MRTVLDPGNSVPTYYEYRLVPHEAEWRIDQLLSFLEAPGSPLVDAFEAERLLASATADAELPSLPSDATLDLPSLFEAGRTVMPFDDPVPLEVVPLGDITCGTGVLTVRDFGYGGFDLEPLARRVPPGTYEAEVSVAAGTNVALRVRLSDTPPATWHPAQLADGSSVVGVDAGNVAVLDLGTLVRCEAQHVEELFTQLVEQLDPGTVFSLDGHVSDAVIVTSGYGDGAYPCYWGVAEDGSLAVLIVDFMVLVEEVTERIQVPWTTGPVRHAALVGPDLEIVDLGGSFEFRHRGGDVRKLRVLAPDGSELVDAHQLGLMVSGDLHTQTWIPERPPPSDSQLEVTLDRGYRHI